MSLIACGAVGWMADMNMRPGRCAGHATFKRDKRYTRAAQMADQGLAFGAVRMERDVHGVAMIEAHLIVRGRLPIGGYRQRTSEGLRGELFQGRRVFWPPPGG